MHFLVQGRFQKAQTAYRDSLATGRATAFRAGFKAFFSNGQLAGNADAPKPKSVVRRVFETLSGTRFAPPTAAVADALARKGERADAIGLLGSSLMTTLNAIGALDRAMAQAKPIREVAKDEEFALIRDVSSRLKTTDAMAIRTELVSMANSTLASMAGHIEGLVAKRTIIEMEEAARYLDHLFETAPKTVIRRLGGRAKIQWILGEGIVSHARARLPLLDGSAPQVRKEKEAMLILRKVAEGSCKLIEAIHQAVVENNRNMLETSTASYSAAMVLVRDKPQLRDLLATLVTAEELDLLLIGAGAIAEKAARMLAATERTVMKQEFDGMAELAAKSKVVLKKVSSA